jgi:exonuclease III
MWGSERGTRATRCSSTLRRPQQTGQTDGERAQLERIISHGLVDLSRKLHPDDERMFSWWAPWRNMRERDIGWRLDYVLAAENLAQKVLSCEIFREVGTSDHGPVLARFDVNIVPREPEPEEPEPEPEPQPPSAAGSGQLSLF